MNRGFKYLVDQYGNSGAREKFEEICFRYVQETFGLAYSVESYPGDDGIDIYVQYNDTIVVYQCKFFITNMGDAQKNQVRKSYNTLMNSLHKDRVIKWILCIPIKLTSKSHDWWIKWSSKKSQEHGITIELLDESNLISNLKKSKLYKEYFEIIELDKNVFGSIIKDEYIKNLSPIIYNISNNNFQHSNIETIIAFENIVNKYKFDPFFENNDLIIGIDCLTELVSSNAQDGVINNRDVLDTIYSVRDKILKEYQSLFYIKTQETKEDE
ncbi:hypothetical protein [Alkalibaculum bacchi]|uniref:hypothetical protein n=1 Tax=Alkalibaculum bacchi TaxID=645887 RepID=UPI0026EF5480|nr:hypothetical protein [Alkalibaculum bacchi]